MYCKFKWDNRLENHYMSVMWYMCVYIHKQARVHACVWLVTIKTISHAQLHISTYYGSTSMHAQVKMFGMGGVVLARCIGI